MIGSPEHPFATGVMVKVTVCCTAVVFVSIPEMFPVPFSSPTTAIVLSLVQLNVVFATVCVNDMAEIEVPEQMVCVVAKVATVGLGLTVIEAVIVGPLQPFELGLIVNTAVCTVVVLFISEPLISPLPLAGIPVKSMVSVLVHVKVVPATFPERRMSEIVPPEQIVCEEGVAAAFGVGFTKTDTTIGTPSQLFAVGVTVKFTV